jgi:hypothetical protein
MSVGRQEGGEKKEKATRSVAKNNVKTKRKRKETTLQQQQQHNGSSKQDEQVVGNEVRDRSNSRNHVEGWREIGNDDSNDNCKSDGDTAPQRRIGSNSEECIETNISEIVAGSTQLESERLNAESHGSNDEQSEGCAKMIFDSTKPQTISDADGDIVPEAASYIINVAKMHRLDPQVWMNSEGTDRQSII